MKVFPNPLSAKDALGRPCGVVPIPRTTEYVGASLCPKRTEVHPHEWESEQRLAVMVNGAELISRPQTNCWVFNGVHADDPDLMAKLYASEPIELPNSPYFVRALLSGELLAGDAETAKAFGVKAPPAPQKKGNS